MVRNSWFFYATAMLLLAPTVVLADCSFPRPDGAEISIKVKSCRAISAAHDETLAKAAGAAYGLFIGARVEDENGTVWMYPSSAAEPCAGFRIGEVARKSASRSCCDTGQWGKCALGGRFLGDIGGPAVDAAQ